jgi:hypothetical protein
MQDRGFLRNHGLLGLGRRQQRDGGHGFSSGNPFRGMSFFSRHGFAGSFGRSFASAFDDPFRSLLEGTFHGSDCRFGLWNRRRRIHCVGQFAKSWMFRGKFRVLRCGERCRPRGLRGADLNRERQQRVRHVMQLNHGGLWFSFLCGGHRLRLGSSFGDRHELRCGEDWVNSDGFRGGRLSSRGGLRLRLRANHFNRDGLNCQRLKFCGLHRLRFGDDRLRRHCVGRFSDGHWLSLGSDRFEMSGLDSRRLRFGSRLRFGKDRFNCNGFGGHWLRFGNGHWLSLGSGRFEMSSRDCHRLRFGSFGKDRFNCNGFGGHRLRFSDGH